MKVIKKKDILSTIKVGDDVKVSTEDYRFAEKLKDLKELVLRVEAIHRESHNSLALLKFIGIKDRHWEGFFKTLPKQARFCSGDKIKYVGTSHRHLDPNEEYTVNKVIHIGIDDAYLVSLKEEIKGNPNEVQPFYVEFAWVKADQFEEHTQTSKPDPFPFFSEILLDLCNKDLVSEDTGINISIVNSNVKGERNYTKNDLMFVLRTLEDSRVEADLLFNSNMQDALTVVLNGRDVMEELSDSNCPCKPLYALTELSNFFDITVTIDNLNTIYIVGFNGIVYESKEIPVLSVQEA